MNIVGIPSADLIFMNIEYNLVLHKTTICLRRINRKYVKNVNCHDAF